MIPLVHRILLAAGAEETSLRFRSLPPLWLLFMVVLPVTLLFVYWIYKRESRTAPPGAKSVLGAIRIAVIALVLFLLFQPYAETSVRKKVKSDLVVLVDTSASMEFQDTYSDPSTAQKTRAAAGLLGSPGNLSSVPRIGLLKGTLSNKKLDILGKLGKQFNLHVYSFDRDTVLLGSTGESGSDSSQVAAVQKSIQDLSARGSRTDLGDAISQVIDEYRLKDQPLAGVVVFTDGRQTGGSTGPVAAARKAAASEPPVPLYVVGVGDPDEPRNIHVTNLRAREVVLRGDDVDFEFSVSNKGFAGRPVTAVMETVGPKGKVTDTLDLKNAEVTLGPDGREQVVRVIHKFTRAGSYSLKVGIPVQRGERIQNDNFLVHQITVVDKKIKVLYVDGYPRWEYRFLKNALVRDTDTVKADVLNLDADPGVVQPFSEVPGWGPIDHFPRTKEGLYKYDVLIFGDVDWTQLGTDQAQSKQILSNVKQFVEDGGGFIMVAGPYDSPRSYRNTPIADILPVVLSREEEIRADVDPTHSFNIELTPEGRQSSIMQVANDPETSRQIWEDDKFSAQFWYYPVERAKLAATILAVHPGQYDRNKFGPHVLIATMPFGKGRSLYVGLDELWRLRWSFGNRYYYRFYGEAIRALATYKLLGGNKRFKIFTDRNIYFVGDPVTISAQVYDRDFNPSRSQTQEIEIRSPDGNEHKVSLHRVPNDPGDYRLTVTVNQEGTYRLTASVPSDEERPEKLFKVEYSTEEMKHPLMDLDTLHQMAAQSNGKFIPLYKAGDIPASIPSRSVFVSSEVRSKSIWDQPWVLLLFTALLAAEWLIRKRYRLL